MPYRKINFYSQFSIKKCPVVNADFRNLSVHYLIRIWTTCRRNVKQIVCSKMYKLMSFLTKTEFLKHFWRSVDAILRDVSVAETISYWLILNIQTTIFQCSKNYSCPTRVTCLTVPPNMADPTSMKHSVSSLTGDGKTLGLQQQPPSSLYKD